MSIIILVIATVQNFNTPSTQAVLSTSTPPHTSQIRIGSFNTLWRGFDTEIAPDNAWEKRMPRMQSILAYANYDIVGMQEVWDSTQYSDIKALLPEGYRATSFGAVIGYTPIFYKYTRFKLLSQGSFRIVSQENKGCTWALLQDIQTSKRFYVFNTHFDRSSFSNRQLSAELVLKNIQSITNNQSTTFLIGDFNAYTQEDSAVLSQFANERYLDALEIAPPNNRDNPTLDTFHAFKYPVSETGIRVDRIYLHKYNHMVEVLHYETIDKERVGEYASDHHPILAVVQIKD